MDMQADEMYRQDPLGSCGNPRQVSHITGRLSSLLGELPATWIEGEVTQLSPRRIGVFLTLKDMNESKHLEFFLPFDAFKDEVEVGNRVKIHGKLEFWATSGQIKVKGFEIQSVGIGELIERIARLRVQLALEGLYEHKRPLPFIPKLIGLVTGQNSDAEKDVVTNVLLRWPAAKFCTIYASMQGASCASETISAIQKLDANNDVDVIIVARGGGSFHDLIGFSDEQMIRAVFSIKTPLISAIGHEADRPILDEVADLRASTPTDAAKRVVPDIADEKHLIKSAMSFLKKSYEPVIDKIKCDTLSWSQAFSNPFETFIAPRRREIDLFYQQMLTVVWANFSKTETEIAAIKKHLLAISPQNTLVRGYAMIEDETGRIISSADKLSAGDTVTLRLHDGLVRAEITQ
ncbi:exodeoxyribonuclease VII large subunit [Tropheryma whipplei]|uniref:exodeoxyribonuclease VII large subunit n=2 Tax=Tropheryma whipplei TaxID=2039 RepID=UPI0004B47834|nr:exodeoxyribonuclease VII large subunit [Tropheryma whipplei]